MNTETRRMLDSEKKEEKVWARPVLTRLDVRETKGKSNACNNDSQFVKGPHGFVGCKS